MSGQATNQIKEGFRQAERLTARHASSFYFASHFLPRPRRQAAYVLYAICRLSDDSVDLLTTPDTSLEHMRGDIGAAYGTGPLETPLLHAFREMIRTYSIPRHYFDQLTDGIAMDLAKNRYADFDELYDYSYKVAGVVGLMMVHIMTTPRPDIELYAVNLGIAMQLTNIIRDIKEDAQRNRIYLPQDELRQFGLSDEDILENRYSLSLESCIKFQINRARVYYASAKPGMGLIPEPGSRFVVKLMKNMYEQILSVVERNHFRIFSGRSYVPWAEKVGILGKTLIGKT